MTYTKEHIDYEVFKVRALIWSNGWNFSKYLLGLCEQILVLVYE